MRLWWLLQPGVVWPYYHRLTPADALPVHWCSTRKHCCTALSIWVEIISTCTSCYTGGHIYGSRSAPIHHIVLLCKASSVFAHSPCAQNQPAFYIRYFCHLSSVYYAKALLEHEPEVAFPRTELSGCVIPVPLHTAGLGLSAARAPVSLQHFILCMACDGTREARATALLFL